MLKTVIVMSLFAGSLCAQNITYAQYPFSGYGGTKDSKVRTIIREHDQVIDALFFKNKADFDYVKFNEKIYFKRARFLKEASFIESGFEGYAHFEAAQFYGSVFFRNAVFDKRASFYQAIFDSATFFRNVSFNEPVNFSETVFKDSVSFSGASIKSIKFNGSAFNQSLNFRHGFAKEEVSFNKALFKNKADFTGRRFGGSVSFEGAAFAKKSSFTRAFFVHSLSFSETLFLAETDFFQTHFSDTLDLSSCDFRKGVDLRWADFSNVNIILVDSKTDFPDGRFYCEWKDFAGKIELKDDIQKKEAVSLDEIEAIKKYRLIEKFYIKLKENFKAQGELDVEDAIMYDLARAKNNIVGGFLWKIYGWFFGWGYKPWRFILYVVAPLIIIFSLIWYHKYYHVLFMMMYKKEQKEIELDGIALKESHLQKIWRTIHFSASVLLSFRFRKEWIVDQGHFLHIVSLEWLVGILLYILFALLVEGSRFGFIKGLLGFV